MANYKNLSQQNDDLNEEIDYNFFDDDVKDESENNNNAVVEYDKKEKSVSSIKSKTSAKHSSSINSDDVSSSEESRGGRSISSSSSSKKSKESVHGSSLSDSELRSKYSSSAKTSPAPARSESPKISSAHSRPSMSESDVTTVSSLDSEPHSKETDKPSRPMTTMMTQEHDDIDRVQPEAILRAMIRIHEERRAMRHLRPKWVDPTSKDYSVSGITKKMNMVPEKIVTISKKNIRNNPFFSHYREPSRRPYHTAINREKELDRIEKENRNIYDRLKKIQPSPGITKQQLLKEYSKISRFSLPPNFRPLTATTMTSYPTTLTVTNSRSSSQGRRTHSSASIHKSKSEMESSQVSRKYSSGRVMSAGSLNSRHSRTTSVTNDQGRPPRK